MIKSFGRLGDFGDFGSGVGGSISIKISVPNETIGRFGIGLSNGGVFLFGISTVILLSSAMTFTKPEFYRKNEIKKSIGNSTIADLNCICLCCIIYYSHHDDVIQWIVFHRHH